MAKKIIFEIELRHKGLNKYRHIKGGDKYIVEQKARLQQATWDEMWSKKLLTEKVKKEREVKKRTKEENKEFAISKTLEAQKNISEIKNILNSTLLINDEINWHKLQDLRPYGVQVPAKQTVMAYPSKPSKPTLTEYTKSPDMTDNEFSVTLGFIDKIFTFRKKKKVLQAQDKFKISYNEWIAKCHEIDVSNQQKNITYEAECKLWNDECEYVDKLKRQTSDIYEKNMAKWIADKNTYEENQKEQNRQIETRKELYFKNDPDSIIDYCEMVLSNSCYPDFFEQEFEIDYNPENKTLIIDFRLPNKDKLPIVKEVKYSITKDEFNESFISDKDLNALYDEMVYQVTLRTHHEIYEADVIRAIDAIVFNGWVEFIEKAYGQLTTACIVSLQTSKDEFLAINLANIDPKVCFKQLRGIGSSKLYSITPIAPILAINKEDRRFVDAYSVANDISDTTNLAAMDWQDFENLIREIFEKEFATSGGEVKITQASRDGGVDAIAFDPDPIRGGKIVIQAKRYTNVVGVSAVRDLYGTTMNEGATKGILVTTADFGPDAYEFVKGKPLTLLNGGNLLHLLAKHGHKAKIDLKEAKKILSALSPQI